MTRLVHVSDLHFGRVRPELIPPLVATITLLAPDLVIISGDLTQRARKAQFRQAAALIAAFKCPVLTVPGNHDVPLWNVWFRVSRPYARYQRLIAEELEETVDLPGVSVLGVNSVDPLAWQRGRFSSRRIARTVARLQAASGPVRVLVQHHPLVHPEGADKELARGAEAAARAFAAAGADLVLSGHLHFWSTRAMAPAPDLPAMILAEAGTGLSTRLRGAPNDFNLIETAPERIAVTRYVARADGLAFEAHVPRLFERGPGGWEEKPKIDATAATSLSQSASVT